MTGITLEMAEQKLAEYLRAESRILKGQRAEMDGTSLTRADLKTVQEGVALWNSRVQSLSGSATGRIRSVEVIPR